MLTIDEILAGKTQEDKKKEEIPAELLPFGRLRVNGPIYTDFATFKKIEATRAVYTAESSLLYTSGYFNHQTGRFSCYPQPQ